MAQKTRRLRALKISRCVVELQLLRIDIIQKAVETLTAMEHGYSQLSILSYSGREHSFQSASSVALTATATQLFSVIVRMTALGTLNRGRSAEA